ncbi:hypothetical protein PR048_003012 [Dryococelus australis]|uniref:Uncharacterized protein n=1 Tax=Dryococelus australis TaxID=614101 RepID=A0ABQ9ILS5_9NEOP|nr:hypothetical protein PR048_003012 [Dryococelus australis]
MSRLQHKTVGAASGAAVGQCDTKRALTTPLGQPGEVQSAPARLPRKRTGSTPPPPSPESRAIPGYLQVGIVPDDAAGRWFFSGISRFPRPFVPVLLQTRLNHQHRHSRHRS